MKKTDERKFAEIIAKGGSVVMHKNDLERLKEATQLGRRPRIFNDVKIIEDRLGGVKEGTIVAVDVGKCMAEINFRTVF